MNSLGCTDAAASSGGGLGMSPERIDIFEVACESIISDIGIQAWFDRYLKFFNFGNRQFNFWRKIVKLFHV